MTTEESLDDVHRQVLDSIESVDRLTWMILALAGLFEVGLGVALIWLTDFSDPLQRLIFLAVATIYAPLAVFLFGVSYHADRNSQRILKAIALLSELRSDDGQGRDARRRSD